MVVYVDTNTPRPFVEDFSVYGDDGGAYEAACYERWHLYLDAMGLGMGCCCLQVTFQAQSIDEARFLYDQLTPLTPIMVNSRNTSLLSLGFYLKLGDCFKLAISAASPIWRGYLAEIDCRWNVLCAMSDDRTAEERGYEVNSRDSYFYASRQTEFLIPKSLKNERYRIPKSRYSSVDCYISSESAAYNDH